MSFWPPVNAAAFASARAPGAAHARAPSSSSGGGSPSTILAVGLALSASVATASVSSATASASATSSSSLQGTVQSPTATGHAHGVVSSEGTANGSVATAAQGHAHGVMASEGTANGSVSAGWANTYSIDLDGVDDFIDVSAFDPSSQIGTGDFTMTMWLKADSSANQIFWYLGDSSTNNMMRMNYLASSGGFKIWATSGGTWTNQYPHVNIATSTGTWYNVTVTRSSTTITLYVNGSTNSDSKTHNSLGTGFGSIHNVGKYLTSHYLDGHIDEYALWDEALTSSEVDAIYNSGTPIDLASDSGNYASSANLVGYWRMEEGSGTSVADSSTNSNTATLTNGPTFVTDVPAFSNSYSIDLDGTNDYISISGFNPNSLIGTGDMSISFWVNFDNPGGGNEYPFYMGKLTANEDYFLVRVLGSTSKIELFCRNNTGTTGDVTIRAAAAASSDTWYHVVVTRSGTTGELFINGSSEGSTTDSDFGTEFATSGSGLSLGSFRGVAGYLSGKLDEFAVWDSALTSSEVSAIYNSGTPINLASDSGNYTSSGDLIGYWRFEENSGTTIADSSTNSNTATLTNGPTFSTDVA